ncbi:aminotransferase class III-fold pyridoxal phosphate-dependent enzyme [Paenibacillus sp. IHBB 10380]|uniref:aminotransferase class III-fold pyridoxal phosphate-dependent enzyme n=1 Tax=Paenibacillus sp. IHBB 10380 TaxID=1566358 RepID=UPI0005CFB4CE|nr:aminotransferase class III-fold pyridoxal phosphate-dependent enzyme [Paenibacillus sp. IHBB 10380]AJS57205.1 hypothetical protein UB51_00330 [Paenibacillus sp. IHBB 10380]
MDIKQNIYLDDWNCVFRKIPEEITKRSTDILAKGINYNDSYGYELLKQNIKDELQDIGEYELLCYISGSQAVDQAVLISQHQYKCTKLFKMKEVYHGLEIMHVDNADRSFKELELCYFSIDEKGELIADGLMEASNCIILTEPLYLFAQYGSQAFNIMKNIQRIADQNHHILIVDEVRSGVWKSGTFLLSEQFNHVTPHVICFSKGLGLSISISAACFNKQFYNNTLLKKMDVIKSNLSLSELAIQRANDLLGYSRKNEMFINNKTETINSWIKNGYSSIDANDVIKQFHTSGLILVLVFNENLSKMRVKMFRQILLSKKIIVRHCEDRLLYINFPIDTEEAEVIITFDIMKETIKAVSGE